MADLRSFGVQLGFTSLGIQAAGNVPAVYIQFRPLRHLTADVYDVTHSVHRVQVLLRDASEATEGTQSLLFMYMRCLFEGRFP